MQFGMQLVGFRKSLHVFLCLLYSVHYTVVIHLPDFFKHSEKKSPNFIRKKLKGHGNEADFLGFLQKLGPHRSLTLPFEPFRFWLRIRGDIRNGKTTPRLGESLTLRLGF